VYRGTVVHSVVIGELIVLKDTSVGVRGDGTIGECGPKNPLVQDHPHRSHTRLQ
jgi:hypothetical protein